MDPIHMDNHLIYLENHVFKCIKNAYRSMHLDLLGSLTLQSIDQFQKFSTKRTFLIFSLSNL
jgi:hypothetical protein